MDIDTSIFKSYDIRGVYPTQLNEEIAYRIARAYAEIIKRENPGKEIKIVVGYDMRISTPSLREQAVKGLLDSGVDVVDVGLVSTPTFYFAVAYYGYDGGMQVSASHNPKEYNGFKMVRQRGIPVSGEKGIMEIKDMVIKNDFPGIADRGVLEEKTNVIEECVKVEREGTNWQNIKPFKIVVDGANAMGTLDVDAMFKQTNCELIKLNWELDGSFPAHQPDPLQEENLIPTQEKVREIGADLGIIPDGDGDRYFFVDEKGDILRQEILRGIMAQIELLDHPGAVVAYDIRPGKITQDMIEEAGGKPIVTKVGHSLIKEHMIKENAIFGGESSGHYFYKMPFGTFEAPVKLALKFLAYLSKQNKPLSEVIAPLKRYFHSGEINSKVTDVNGKLSQIKDKYSDADISTLDGVTITYPDYWFNVRGSNTEPLIRLNLEAKSNELMEAKRDEVLALIQS